MGKAISILLVDDHAMVRDNLRDRLTRELDFTVVATAKDADEAVSLAHQTQPDVVILDIDMPGRTSFEAAKDIKAQHNQTRIIYLSGFTNDRYIEGALSSHASAYVTKEDPPHVLIKAIRSVAMGVAYFSEKVRSRLVIGSKVALRPTDSSSTRISLLTQRELEVLRYLARGMTKKEIARVMHRTYSTVDKHTENIMAKVDIHDRVELARFAIREGLIEA